MDDFLIWLWKNNKKIILWFFWVIIILSLGLYFYQRLTGNDKTLFLPSQTSDGHYQIEMDCYACHDEKSDSIKQKACLDCHKEKKRADSKSNSHRAKLFEDVEKADQLEKIRADQCVTCHQEHQLGIAGFTQTVDICFLCHEDVASDTPSHKDLPFDECADCHNYHDNSVNYFERFIKKHLSEEADTFEQSLLLKRNFSTRYKKKHAAEPLHVSDRIAPASVDVNSAQDWNESSHALTGVNCNACHLNKDNQWNDQPDHSYCLECHKQEVKGFLSSRHGMRLKQDLSPMTTSLARLPMKNEDLEMTCVACHKDHLFDTKSAAVESCLNCHNDQHSLAYKASQHYQLWLKEDPRGASCATCHMPRIKKGKKVWVQHNQNDNLRPVQKMAKNVCIMCHGLGFSIDALNDQHLLDINFSPLPAKHIPLLELWKNKLVDKE